VKQSHISTPRTLAECQWTTGYSSSRPPRGDTAASIALAISIGVLLALALVHWWAS
jgi:hypothetical protein